MASKPTKNSTHSSLEKVKESLPLPVAWPKEIGGQKGLEPTRYGDWENKGRCTDF